MIARKRRAAGANWYDSTEWRSTIAKVVKGKRCVDGCGRAAAEGDHVPPRLILLALGVHRPDDPRWVQPRCKSCHSYRTATVDRPLLARLDAGEDPSVLAAEAEKANTNHSLRRQETSAKAAKARK